MNSNAKAVDTKLREIFMIEADYSAAEQTDESSWAHLITEIIDATHQVVEIRGAFPNKNVAKNAARVALSLTGADLPQLLGIQAALPDGTVQARVKRSEIMLLNQPLGTGRPEGWA